MRLKTLGSRVKLSEIVEKMMQFDQGSTGKVKIYHFINVLKHNYPNIFDTATLVGLQFELESLNDDNCVDYKEFVNIFMDKQEEHSLMEIKLDKRSTYQISDYEDLLSNISHHIKEQNLEMHRIFKIFMKQGNSISYGDLKKIMELIQFPLNELQFRLLVNFADENGEGHIPAMDLASQIQYAKQIAPSFDINKWMVASRALNGRFLILERILLKIDLIKDTIASDPSIDTGSHSGVMTGEQFYNLLKEIGMDLSENDVDLAIQYAIRGSRRLQTGEAHPPISMKNDLIQFFNFEKSLIPVTNSMKNEDYERKQKDQKYDGLDDSMRKLKRELDRKQEEQRQVDERRERVDP